MANDEIDEQAKLVSRRSFSRSLHLPAERRTVEESTPDERLEREGWRVRKRRKSETLKQDTLTHTKKGTFL